MIIDVEHLFMCQLAICLSSLEKGIFSSSAHFKFRSFVPFVVVVATKLHGFFYILNINPYYWQIFPPFHRLPFHLVPFYFDASQRVYLSLKTMM